MPMVKYGTKTSRKRKEAVHAEITHCGCRHAPL